MLNSKKWLVLPPAVALLLVLGPMSMGRPTNAASAEPITLEPIVAPTTVAPTTVAPAAAATNAPSDAGPVPARPPANARPPLPKTPDPWQVAATLCGLLLLGAAGLFVLRRVRRGGPQPAHGVATLRQTIRLSARQAVHAIEFDGRLLLVGEGERGVQLLHATAVAAPEADLAELGARSDTEPPDDGAVPKNLVIPRPRPPAQKPAAAPGQPTQKAPARRPGLGDFRALLAKAGR